MPINISIDKFLEQFNKEYDFLYENEPVAGQREATEAFDEFLKNPQHASFVGEFARFRRDFITSDREAAAFMFALDTLTE